MSSVACRQVGVINVEVSPRDVLGYFRHEVSKILQKRASFKEKIYQINIMYIKMVIQKYQQTGVCKYCEHSVGCIRHHLLHSDCYLFWQSQLYDFTKKLMNEHPHFCVGVVETPLEIVLKVMPPRNNRDNAVVVALSTLENK